ncbi:MAG TPA: FAD-dependent oxidoreductase [Egibacteraceae bacterium]|nr:FAD-dependent oxidoreductase [Actinomycetota bacterium]HWB72236.1 FAD-dependent oxidoreductase [Egibacteraceae bacterium]
MAKVVVVGDGPAGLSAALFLAKNDQDVLVYAQDNTAMHYAELHNYLGIRQIDGSEFQAIAREQTAGFGADLREEEVTDVVPDGATFVVRTNGAEERADYVVLAGGKAAQRLARGLGAATEGGTVAVDTEYRTGVDRVYAVGRVARPNRSQAIISAGAGATAALDILAREAGKDVTDWDTPSDG